MIDEKKLIELCRELKEKETGAFSKGYNKALRDIVSTIKSTSFPKVGECIPVSERLPNGEDGLYWTTHEDGSLILHGYTKNNGFIYNWEVYDLEKRKRQGEVIAWM